MKINCETEIRTERHAAAAPAFARAAAFVLLGATVALCGCQELTYTGPTGERFTRRCLGTSTSLGLLTIDTATNGVRRVQLRGYQNEGTQALGVVTEAAVRAALQSPAR